MPCVGFEPTTSVSERTKAVHVLESVVTVVGCFFRYLEIRLAEHVTCMGKLKLLKI
jgi:hypothetical protein